MPLSIWDTSVRSSFANRVEKLSADAKPGWGRFSASGMLAHLNDSYRMAIGELAVKPKHLPLRYTPIKQLVIYVLPFPKGAPTAPELIARCGTAVLADEKAALTAMFTRLGTIARDAALPEHPAFGKLSYDMYGALMARHTEHHLRQFNL
jgi:hypothetical protein